MKIFRKIELPLFFSYATHTWTSTYRVHVASFSAPILRVLATSHHFQFDFLHILFTNPISNCSFLAN